MMYSSLEDAPHDTIHIKALISACIFAKAGTRKRTFLLDRHFSLAYILFYKNSALDARIRFNEIDERE